MIENYDIEHDQQYKQNLVSSQRS